MLRSTAFLVAFLSVSALSSAAPLGVANSSSDYTIQAGETVTNVSGKTFVEQGQTLSTQDHSARFYGQDGTSLLVANQSNITLNPEQEFVLNSGSVVASGSNYSVSPSQNLIIKAGEETTLIVNKFKPTEVSLQVNEGSVQLLDQAGTSYAELSTDQTMSLIQLEDGSWSTGFQETGAPSVSNFFAQVGEGTQSGTIDEDEEDNRKGLLLIPAIVVGAVAAGYGGYVVYDEVIDDDDNDDNDKKYDSPIGRSNAVFTVE